MEQITRILMQLIKSEVLKQELCLSCEMPLSAKSLVELLVLSHKHNVSNLAASALLNNGLLEGFPQKGQFLNEFYRAVYEQEKISATFDEVCRIFEENHIPFIPLKGAVIRNFYPQPWMRTSCDIDILVKEENLKAAVNAFESIEGYSVKNESNHDMALVSPNGTLLEFHYKLIGNKKSPLYSELLTNVWDSAEQVNGSGFKYKLSDEVFYYYHILHMAKHFRLGGCGLRPFVDLVLIEKELNVDVSKLNKTLKKGKLFVFAENVRKLSRVWFFDEKHDETTLQMEKFIIEGGTFGSAKTRTASANQRSGGKLQYMLSRVFVPYRYLKRDYPILEKFPILTPWYEICRICSLLIGKKKGFRERYIRHLDKDAETQLAFDQNLFKKLGLK